MHEGYLTTPVGPVEEVSPLPPSDGAVVLQEVVVAKRHLLGREEYFDENVNKHN